MKTLAEAFKDPNSLIKNQSDVDDITLNGVTTKGVILGANEDEGRNDTLWFKNKTEKANHLKK